MDDDDEWNLYQLLIAENKPSPERLVDDFQLVDADPLRVSYSDLPQLIDNEETEEIPWFMKETFHHKSEQQNTCPPALKRPSQSHKRAQASKLFPQASIQPLMDKSHSTIVKFYFSAWEEPFEFVFLPEPSHEDSGEESCLGQLPQDIISNAAMLQNMKRYVELAKGAYATDEESLRERAGLDETQLYHVDFRESSGSFPRPAFYLAVNDQLQAIILSIRGTKSALEFQIDAKWTPVEFPQLPGAYVHQGIFLAARWFVDQVLGRLVKLAELFPNYNVRIIGHSLGGGIAALFTLMIKDVIPSAKAVIFAPPACVSSKLLAACRDCCVSFVNRTDILPYLTHANFTSIFSGRRIIDVLKNKEEVDLRNKPELWKEDVTNPPGRVKTPEEVIANGLIQFYPPGNLHHIFKSLGGTFHLRSVPNDYFTNRGFANISRTMIRHHKLDSYKNAFYKMAE